MDQCCQPISLHPQFFELLFVFKSKVSAVFREVLGIHEIAHIAINRINDHNQLISFSSTPAMEFNLFNSTLWRFDKTYQPEWFSACTEAPWQMLYTPERYDELYYLKQIKHHYPLGLSIGMQHQGAPLILSLASNKACSHTQEVFANHSDDFQKIGQYCFNRLSSLFAQYNGCSINAVAEASQS